MKGFFSHINVPDWLDSPVPVLRARQSKKRHLMNCLFLIVYTTVMWHKGNCPTALLDHFPWLAVTLLFGALLLVVEDPIFRNYNYKRTIVGHYINILSAMRLIFVLFSLRTTEGMMHFLELDTFALDVSYYYYYTLLLLLLLRVMYVMFAMS